MIFFILIVPACSDTSTTSTDNEKNDTETLTVAVSIIPQETFVKKVAGDSVNVVTMIPPGSSPSSYEPTAKEMTELSESSIYFSIGVPTEKANILPKLTDFNENIKEVSLQEAVEKSYSPRYFSEGEEHTHEDENSEEHEDEHEDGSYDPHIWMSPKRVIVMVESIRDEFIELDSENEELYNSNADKYINELKEVDSEIQETLNSVDNKSFIIFHPSMGYFADDYNLEMKAIEEDGKDATAKKIQTVIDFANENNIKVIFYQEEFDDSQAETIAEEIGGSTLKLAPLAPDYINNLKTISDSFKDVLN
jgi:zinc transport system substrate-binding protein